MLATEYVRSPIGVAKFLVLITTASTLVLSGSTRPTDLQKKLVGSTWKEDGLFYLSIVGIVVTLCSVAWGIFFFKECSRRDLRMNEIVLFGIACTCFTIFGAATLESALTIYIRIGDCCQDAHNETTNTCTLPGIVDQYYDNLRDPAPVTPTAFDFDGEPFSVKVPTHPKCDSVLEFDSWRCTVCVNELVQPEFEMKGAAGAAGLIAALAYFIVVFVDIREIRARKPTLASTFRYN